MDAIFDACVLLLVFLANQLGMTYKAINVWIFVILWPSFTFTLLVLAAWQGATISRLRRQSDQPRASQTRPG